MGAYSQSIRQEAARLYDEGHTQKSISESLQVPYKTIRNWIKRYGLEGSKGLIPHFAVVNSNMLNPL
jgi:transposase